MTAFIFLVSAAFGFVIGLIVRGAVSHDKVLTVYKTGVDPDKLVAWIECQLENYEYVAPPTAGEIIRKIREMENEI